ncbi:beta-1,4-N-acetylgalactosaminyltransferase bre-4-like isoform X2 [Portunus trituberculatus]|nr:beta-1,4-N-acetylgalactosaminyltransferase bre-4-like isoform X2 [Portunus trituberculatus]XP_045138671.1 beta-1,4-N-acetylgalactosaminyltransferase bre-4-like isoform X2 [Portunus trituberculatus]XP_045138672.1 beta-1,4-N-acetylgalactosaminyltransferase bre-4-like isoform X2 [Portunus trituberculatus]XP_045138673.1 beta-1,4-N-acetylgalactosaminyltransferase bre-4-like isoform X2 [Portunus trituberculatus]
MVPAEDAVIEEGGTSCSLTGSFCRPRPRRVLLLVVAVLVLGQLSLNMLFYRNSDSLFYVNTTASAAGPLLLDSRLWWTSSRLPWLQPVPVNHSNHTPSLPITNTSSSQPGRRAEGTEAERRQRTRENSSTNLEEESVGSGTRPVKLQELAAAPPTMPANSPRVALPPSAAVPPSNDNKLTSNNEGLGRATQAAVSVDKPLCPPVPPKLVGVVKVNKSAPSLEEQERAHPELAPGGHFQPGDCMARHKVAIIIPYRDRVSHLSVLLHHLHPILQRQQVDYTIFVVEQAGTGKFNRAMLMNVGALEALRHYPFNCFIFHDVDLLLEDDRNLYTCPEQPRHMSIAIDNMKYRLPYNDIFGGVSAMTVEQFRTVNGFSNKFWGWGGEDDDMSNRIKHHGFFISRYPANVGRYTMLTHKKDNPNPRRYQYLHEGKKRYSSDGLNSVKYRLLDTQLRRLYTWVYVDLYPS